MAATDVWPFHGRVEDWNLPGRTVTGGQSVSGLVQTARTDGGGFWTATFEEVFLRTADDLRLWRAWDAITDGGVEPVFVPMCDVRQAPWTFDDLSRPIYPATELGHSDDSLFSDGTGYDHPVTITASLVGAAALRATQIVIKVTVGGDLEAGQHFSLSHATKGKRLYRIRRVISRAGQDWTVDVRPPLRQATTNGLAVDFVTPGCVMRSVGSLPAPVELGKRSKSSAAFVEYFGPGAV